MFWKSSSSFLLHLKYGISESLCQPTWEFPHLWVSYNEVLHYYCLNLFHLDLLLLEAKHILTDPVLSGSLLSVCAQSLQLCPTLCYPLDCSPPGSSVHGVLQARILEWVVLPSWEGSSRPRDCTCVTFIAGVFFTHWATWETQRTAY